MASTSATAETAAGTMTTPANSAAFGGVVILTMIAAMGFDPRLAWRLAGHRRHLSSAELASR